MDVRGEWVGSGEDAGTEAFANVVVDGGSSAIAGTETCNSLEAGTVVEANDGARASCRGEDGSDTEKERPAKFGSGFDPWAGGVVEESKTQMRYQI